MSSVPQWSTLTGSAHGNPLPSASRRKIRGGELYRSRSLTCPANPDSLCLTNSETWRCARRREPQTSRIAEEAFGGGGDEESEEEAADDKASPPTPAAPWSSDVQQLRQSVSRALVTLPGTSERAEASASQVEQSGSGNLRRSFFFSSRFFFFRSKQIDLVEQGKRGERQAALKRAPPTFPLRLTNEIPFVTHPSFAQAALVALLVFTVTREDERVNAIKIDDASHRKRPLRIAFVRPSIWLGSSGCHAQSSSTSPISCTRRAA